MYCYVGLGSNLDNPEQQLDRALQALDDIPDTRRVTTSSFYRSAPLGPSDQPDFINAVAQLDTALTPGQLLARMQAIENRQGRVRNGPRWGARTLDLDLLLYGNQVIAEPELTVPHPELRHRNFVLAPLLELNPELEIPGLGPAADLLAAAARAPLTRLDQPHTHAA